MPWKQLYTSNTPDDRIEIALHMLRVVTTRRRRRLLVGLRLVRERRGGWRRFHYIHNRRAPGRAARRLSRILFMFILATLSLATWLVALHIHPRHGAPMLFAWSMLLLTVLLVKPYRRVMVQR
jgi:hypothetical protein